MSKMARRPAPTGEAQVNVADAKSRLSELLGRVAFGGETVLITRRGKPMARLVPPTGAASAATLGEVVGWLDAEHPFFKAVDDIVAARARHTPRVLKRPRRRR